MNEIGKRVHVKGYVEKYRPVRDNRVTLISVSYPEPREVLVLGKSKRFTGILQSGWDEPSYLSVAESHDVWIVMEIDKNNRFREPFAVLEEQIINE